MASTITSSLTTLLPLSNSDLTSKNVAMKPSVSFWRTTVPRMPALSVVCAAAKPDTVEKVIDIVRSQLALKEETVVSGETKFTDLGADSLDTVEIVMQLEENFDINVDEDSAQTIATIDDAASLIEDLKEKKLAAAAAN